jgi:hypothetical protein
VSTAVRRFHLPGNEHVWVALALPPDVRPTERGGATFWLSAALLCLAADHSLGLSPAFGVLGALMPQQLWGWLFATLGLSNLYAVLTSANRWLPGARYCRRRTCRAAAMSLNLYLATFMVVAGLVRTTIWAWWFGEPVALPFGLAPVLGFAVSFYYSSRDLAGRV